MKKCIAFQLDYLETLNYETDSSIAIAQAFQRAGYRIFCYHPSKLKLDNLGVFADGDFVEFSSSKEFYKIVDSARVDLSTVSAIFIRQDPPFDMQYITTTYILDTIKDKVRIFNDPTAIRNNPEKLFIYQFKDLIPETIVSQDLDQLREFFHKHGKVVIKPLYGYGGQSIEKISEYKVFNNLLERYLNEFGFVMLQEFIPNADQGDKRVIVINGRVIGAIHRVPKIGEFKANLCLGGVAKKTELTQKEMELSKKVAQNLQAMGILLAGLDIVGEKLIEINITSPTCLKQFNSLYNAEIESLIVDSVKNTCR